ncbi:MAG: hypothetical protein ABJC79_04665 [Acidimicrobiia bacterium]
MEFVDLIIAVHDHLDQARLPHAFGGALALAYIATPRGTVDIDVNIFVPPARLDDVADSLAPLGLRAPEPFDGELPIAGVRFEHPDDPFPVDVFLSLDDRYAEIERRSLLHQFGRGLNALPFLSAEDLCVFKLSFGRPQDWVDLRAIAAARPDLDIETIEELVVALRGPTMYPRVARLRSFLRIP